MTFENHIVASLGLASSGLCWLLAQTEVVRHVLPDGAGTAVSSIIGGSFLIWYSYTVTSVIIPKLNAEHQEQVKYLVTEFRQESLALRDSHEKNLNRVISLLQRQTGKSPNIEDSL